jgi:predicted RNA methylase
MEKEQIEQLKKAFEKIIAEPPFNGTVSHRTRAVFIAKWKEYLKANNIHGSGYIDDLLRAMGKRGGH